MGSFEHCHSESNWYQSTWLYGFFFFSVIFNYTLPLWNGWIDMFNYDFSLPVRQSTEISRASTICIYHLNSKILRRFSLRYNLFEFAKQTNNNKKKPLYITESFFLYYCIARFSDAITFLMMGSGWSLTVSLTDANLPCTASRVIFIMHWFTNNKFYNLNIMCAFYVKEQIPLFIILSPEKSFLPPFYMLFSM